MRAGSNGSGLDSGRASHLSIRDQSIRSEGEPLWPIERLAGSGHYAGERRGLVSRPRLPM